MREITNTPLTGVEPQTLELSSDLLNEARDGIVDVPRLVFENISHQTSFWREKDRILQNRDLYQFFFDQESTTPRKGQVPEQPTRMQEKSKAAFVNQAPIIGWILRPPDRRTLSASGTWPTLETKPSNVMRLLNKKEQIIFGLEVSYY